MLDDPLCSAASMSQAGGPVFDPFLHYYFQNSLMGVGRDEEQSLSYAPELSIEVSGFKLSSYWIRRELA